MGDSFRVFYPHTVRKFLRSAQLEQDTVEATHIQC